MINGTRRGWGVSVSPRPLFTPGKDPIHIAQEAGWDPGPAWRGAEILAPTGIRSPERPFRSQSKITTSRWCEFNMLQKGSFTIQMNLNSLGRWWNSTTCWQRLKLSRQKSTWGSCEINLIQNNKGLCCFSGANSVQRNQFAVNGVAKIKRQKQAIRVVWILIETIRCYEFQ
jgi:hypothetical protein